MFWWSSKKEVKPIEVAPVVEDTRKMLYGHDLAKWEYLGRTTITYTYDKSEESSTDIFFFCKKNDYDTRSYWVVNAEAFRNHGWLTNAALWKVGERELYDVVKAEPSSFLKAYMKEKYPAYSWDKSKKWWVKGADAEYQKALQEQKEKMEKDKDKKQVEEDGNIIYLKKDS